MYVFVNCCRRHWP